MPELRYIQKALWRLSYSNKAESQLTSAESGSSILTEADVASKEPVSSATAELQATHTGSGKKHGLFVLVEKPSEQEGGIDIVAIHGLNGHYMDTWSAQVPGSDQRYNWLEAALPEAIPSARVMSFGYDSAVFSQSVADIDYAQQLLEGLVAKRRTVAEKRRPILFICHGLGGIVFKKALIQAHEHNQYNALLKEVKGVAFFGTPHRGSEVADWAALLGNLAKIVPIGIRTTILNGLKTKSKELLGISQSFVKPGARLNITSFYETYKLDGVNFIVVPKDSALLHLPNETPVPLNGDHRSICKFTKKGDPSLEVVLATIECMANEAIPVTNLECLRALYPGSYEDYEDFKDFNVTRTPGTCEWLLQHSQYREWLNGEQSSLLWISANPGCGKSTLAKFLVDHLRSTRRPTGYQESICHFFFKDGNSAQHDTVLALRAILHQILLRNKALIRHLSSEYELKGAEMMTDFNRLLKVLRAIVRDPGLADVVCILDGIDECLRYDMENLLHAINELCKELDNTPTHYLKLIILSRPKFWIKDALMDFQHATRLKGEDETKAINHDVSLVINHRLERLKEKRQIMPMTLESLSTGLKAGADNTFLWVTRMIDILEKQDKSPGKASHRELLDLLPGKNILFDLYQTMLSDVSEMLDSSEKLDLHRMLRIIIAAKRPLGVEEMNIALTVLPSHKSLEELCRYIRRPHENFIRFLGGSFVRIIHGKVHLVHQTAREFLQKEYPARSSVQDTWRHSIELSDAHATVLEACIFYLGCGERSGWAESQSLRYFALESTTQNQNSILDSRSDIEANSWKPNHQIEFQKLAEIHPFLDYAASLWTYHCQFSKLIPETDLFKHVVEFCQPMPSGPSYPYWTLADALYANFRSLYLDQGRDLTRFERHARVIFSLQHDDIVENFSELHFRDAADDGDSLIHLAASVGSVHGSRRLIGHNVDINALNAQSKTPLDIAIESCYLWVAEILIEAGGSFAFLNGPGWGEPICSIHNRSALHCAAKKGYDGLAELLVKTGSKLNSRDAEGHTPIWAALSTERRSLVDRLISLSTDPDSSENAKEEAAFLSTQNVEPDEEGRKYILADTWKAMMKAFREEASTY